jgi:ferredoxin
MPRIPIVDKEACIGCEACVHICPEVFRMEEPDSGSHHHDHKSVVYNPFGAPAAKIEQAMDSCPVACITWQE